MGGYRAIGKKGFIDRALPRLEEEKSQVVKIVGLGFCILWRRLWLVCWESLFASVWVTMRMESQAWGTQMGCLHRYRLGWGYEDHQESGSARAQGVTPIKHPHGEVKEAIGETREEVRAEDSSVESPLIKLHCQDWDSMWDIKEKEGQPRWTINHKVANFSLNRNFFKPLNDQELCAWHTLALSGWCWICLEISHTFRATGHCKKKKIIILINVYQEMCVFE